MNTGMLASVRDLTEARLAMRAGAHILDLKEPLNGALGAVSDRTLRDVVATVAKQRPVSATIGDLPMNGRRLRDAVRRKADCGPDYIKIGFFTQSDADWVACARALEPCAAQAVSLIAVLFADQEPDLAYVPMFAAHGFRGVMVDTACKDAGPLISYWTMDILADFVEQAHALDMICGLAGSLALDQIPPLSRLGADYLGFRGALCHPSGRTGMLVEERVAHAYRLLQASSHASSSCTDPP